VLGYETRQYTIWDWIQIFQRQHEWNVI
jgi:hypothetical protein